MSATHHQGSRVIHDAVLEAAQMSLSVGAIVEILLARDHGPAQGPLLEAILACLQRLDGAVDEALEHLHLVKVQAPAVGLTD